MVTLQNRPLALFIQEKDLLFVSIVSRVLDVGLFFWGNFRIVLLKILRVFSIREQ